MGRMVVKRMASETGARIVEDGRRHGEQRSNKHVASNRIAQQQKDSRGENVAWRAASGNTQSGKQRLRAAGEEI